MIKKIKVLIVDDSAVIRQASPLGAFGTAVL